MAGFALIGATGRVGQLVTNAWRGSDGPWANTAIQTRALDIPASNQHIPWDITHGPQALKRWMSTYGALDCLVVLAGTTPATGKDMGDNVTLAERYAEAAQACGIGRVLIASSSAVYGAGSGTPLSEDDPCMPLNAYGQSKLDMEKSLQARFRSKSEICCLRIGNVLGADALLLNAATGGPLTLDVFPNGHGPQRSYIGPGVLADVLGQLATTRQTLPYRLNIAAPAPVYMDDLAQAAGLNWTARPAPDTAVASLTLDCQRLVSLVKMPQNGSDPMTLIEDWKRQRHP